MRPHDNRQACSLDIRRNIERVGWEEVTVQQVASQLQPPRPMDIEMFDKKRMEGHLGQQTHMSSI